MLTGVRHERSAEQVHRDVAAGLPLVHHAEDILEDLIVVPVDGKVPVGALGHDGVVEKRAEVSFVAGGALRRELGELVAVGAPIELGALGVRAERAVEGGAHHHLLHVEVVRCAHPLLFEPLTEDAKGAAALTSLAHVEARELEGARAVRKVVRVGDTEVVDELRGLAVVHPVVVGVPLVRHLPVLRELPGNRLPLLARDGVQVLRAAQAVEQRDGEEGLVAVVAAVHAGPLHRLRPVDRAVAAARPPVRVAPRRVLLVPDERPVRPRVRVDKHRGGVGHLVENVALEHRPSRRRLRMVPRHVDGRHDGHGERSAAPESLRRVSVRSSHLAPQKRTRR